jgi:hypothetical protein
MHRWILFLVIVITSVIITVNILPYTESKNKFELIMDRSFVVEGKYPTFRGYTMVFKVPPKRLSKEEIREDELKREVLTLVKDKFEKTSEKDFSIQTKNFADIDADGENEIIVEFFNETYYVDIVVIFDKDGQEYRAVWSSLELEMEDASSRQSSVEIMDVNGDKKEEILLWFETRARWPAVHLYGVAYKDGKYKEIFHFTPDIGSVEVKNINEDSALEVIVNGVSGSCPDIYHGIPYYGFWIHQETLYKWKKDGYKEVHSVTSDPFSDDLLYQFILSLRKKDYKKAYSFILPDELLKEMEDKDLEGFKVFIKRYPELLDDEVSFSTPESKEMGKGETFDIFESSKNTRYWVYWKKTVEGWKIRKIAIE